MVPIIVSSEFNKDLIKFTFKNSRQLTVVEQILWNSLLKTNQLLGYRFIKQKFISTYVADFYCSELLLVVEVIDNAYEDAFNANELRDSYYNKMGITVVKIVNSDITKNMEGVKASLLETVKELELAKNLR